MSTVEKGLEPLLSVAEAADTLGISRAGLWRLVYAGEIEVVAVGGRRLIEPDELRRFIAARRRRGKPTNSEARSAPGLAKSAGADGGDDPG